ncbi:MAG: hypothetical protein K0Q72_2246 [Armatimonadetes bacterium]|jgi:hypothetical protein|nr:hypothetical protein [Armatimonadota bacterium]
MKSTKRLVLLATTAVLTLGTLGAAHYSAQAAGKARDRRDDSRRADVDDLYPELKKKIVPIITFGSSINIGAAQVQGEEADVNRCKAVAQLETDYKDVARIKILVPVQSENVIKNIDRVPGVSVSAIADVAIKR